MTEVNGLVKRYGEKRTVNGVTFTAWERIAAGFRPSGNTPAMPPGGGGELNAGAARHVVLLDLLAAAALAGATLTPEITKGGTSAGWPPPRAAGVAVLGRRRAHPE